MANRICKFPACRLPLTRNRKKQICNPIIVPWLALAIVNNNTDTAPNKNMAFFFTTIIILRYTVHTILDATTPAAAAALYAIIEIYEAAAAADEQHNSRCLSFYTFVFFIDLFFFCIFVSFDRIPSTEYLSNWFVIRQWCDLLKKWII